MRYIYLVRAYADAPVQAYLDYANAYLRKCELDATYGGTASLETVLVEETKLRSYDTVGATKRTLL